MIQANFDIMNITAHIYGGYNLTIFEMLYTEKVQWKSNLQSQPQGLQSQGTSCELHRLRTFLGARRAAGAEYFS